MGDSPFEQPLLPDPEEDRYAALKLIDWFDFERVRKAKVLVVGAGAIGNEVLKNLALLGVGNVFILDWGKIELSNLTRSILFRSTDCGRWKAKTAARAMTNINPDIRVRWRNGDVRFDLGLGFVRRMDGVIGCLDNREARFALNSKCYRVNRPWIDAGIGTLNGQVRVHQPPDKTCYECAFTDRDYKQIVAPCNLLASRYAAQGRVPTTPTIASIVAGVQVQEFLKLLALDDWEDRTMAGKEFRFNGTVQRVDILGLQRRKSCPAHNPVPPERIIKLTSVKASQTTFGELLEIVEEHLGMEATVLLGFDLALSFTCYKCGKKKPLRKPTKKLYLEDLVCSKCGANCELDPNDIISYVNKNQSHFAALRDRSLAKAGIAPLEILTAITASDTTVYFELTGDEQELLESNLTVNGAPYFKGATKANA